MAMKIKYLNSDKARLYGDWANRSKVITELLWGDRIDIQPGNHDGFCKVKARGHTGYLETNKLGD